MPQWLARTACLKWLLYSDTGKNAPRRQKPHAVAQHTGDPSLSQQSHEKRSFPHAKAGQSCLSISSKSLLTKIHRQHSETRKNLLFSAHTPQAVWPWQGPPKSKSAGWEAVTHPEQATSLQFFFLWMGALLLMAPLTSESSVLVLFPSPWWKHIGWLWLSLLSTHGQGHIQTGQKHRQMPGNFGQVYRLAFIWLRSSLVVCLERSCHAVGRP